MGNVFFPLTYSIGLDYIVSNNFSIKSNTGKVYRAPSMNDIYWNPGGNPDLLPENGYNAELGIQLSLSNKIKNLYISFEPTVFTRSIENWIIWTPIDNYWSPQNILQVWSRGIETKNEIKYINNDFQIKLNLLTNYVISTNQIKQSLNDNSVDKQLIYVPMYSGNGKLTFQYKKFSLNYLHSYTGYRFTSSDNSEYLEPFFIANIFASYYLKTDGKSIRFFIKANNIFNANYQIIKNRPMPLSNYNAGIQVQFNKTQNQHKK